MSNYTSDDDLRADLCSQDGLKWVGKCRSISELRATSPTYDKQSIILHCAIENGAIIDAIFFYDASDTISLDDGYRIIVTEQGARWVTDCANGIDIRLAGLLADGSNFSAAANKIIQGEVSKIIKSETSFTRAVQTILVPLPTYLSKNSYYTLEQKITIPSFMGFLGSGWIELRTSLTGDCILVKNDEFPGLTSSMGGYIHSQGFSTFRNLQGKFALRGPGNTISTECGISIGNTSTGDYISVRDLYIRDIQIRNFYNGVGFNGFDTYIITLEDCDLLQNNYNISGLNINKSNSGERIIFRSCTIGNSRSHNIYWNLVGWNVTFDNCSLDYCGGTTLVFANGGRGCVFRFTNGTFIEGFGSNLLAQETVSDSWTYDDNRLNKVIFDTAFINAQGKAGAFSSRRQIIASNAAMLGHVDFINTEIRWPKSESQSHVALLGYTDATASYVRGFFRNNNTPYDQCLMRYGDSLNAGKYKLNGIEGNIVTTDSNTGLTFTPSGGLTATYGGIDASDGYVYINVSATNMTDALEIRNHNLKIPVNRFNQVYSALSIKMSEVKNGNVTLSTKIYYYGEPVFSTTLTSSTYSTIRNFPSLGSVTGDSRNVTALLAAEDTPLTVHNYVGVQTYCEVGYQYLDGVLLASPCIFLSGFVGTVQIKLPVYWLP